MPRREGGGEKNKMVVTQHQSTVTILVSSHPIPGPFGGLTVHAEQLGGKRRRRVTYEKQRRLGIGRESHSLKLTYLLCTWVVSLLTCFSFFLSPCHSYNATDIHPPPFFCPLTVLFLPFNLAHSLAPLPRFRRRNLSRMGRGHVVYVWYHSVSIAHQSHRLRIQNNAPPARGWICAI